jgi:hypothetical protein
MAWRKTAEEYEHQLAVLRSRAGHAEARADKLYDQLRSLEAAVRKSVRECMQAPHGDAAQDAVEPLLRKVPAKPRPTRRKLREAHYMRVKKERERVSRELSRTP